MLALRIALRYLFAKKSHKAVNVISIIAVMGVAVATMAIVIVLSVFNGFTSLSASHLALIDPDLKIQPVQGKVFYHADSLRAVVEAVPGVTLAMPSLQERALAVAGDRQMPVIIKGVEQDRFDDIASFSDCVIDGSFIASESAVCLAVGPAMQLESRPSPEIPVTLYVPRRRGRVNPANPAASYRSAPVFVSGIFAVQQPEYDNDYVVADIDLLRSLLDYPPDAAAALELRLAANASPEAVATKIQAILGPDFTVLTRERQQPETFRMISIEKWVTFLMLVFILIVASFNIVTTLSLMVIEKRADMGTLRALGASKRTIANVFAWEGSLITIAGGIAGIVLGVILAWIQQTFGLIKLGGDPSLLTIDVYPVEVSAPDVLAVAATVVVLSWLLGRIAALFTRKI